MSVEHSDIKNREGGKEVNQGMPPLHLSLGTFQQLANPEHYKQSLDYRTITNTKYKFTLMPAAPKVLKNQA